MHPILCGILCASVLQLSAVAQENSVNSPAASQTTEQEADPQPPDSSADTGTEQRNAANPDEAAETGDAAGSDDAAGTGTETPETPMADLLESQKFETVWKHFSSVENTGKGAVWRLTPATETAEAELTCPGEPRGFLYTVEEYDNFDLTLEWRYESDPNGNSGVLVYCSAEPQLWPTSMQVQLHHPKAGSIFPSGEAVSANTSDTAGLATEATKWNRCRIISRGGTLSVEINGMRAGQVTGCRPAIGHIALQSEGAAVRFRRIRVRRLAPLSQDPSDPRPAVMATPNSPGADRPAAPDQSAASDGST